MSSSTNLQTDLRASLSDPTGDALISVLQPALARPSSRLDALEQLLSIFGGDEHRDLFTDAALHLLPLVSPLVGLPSTRAAAQALMRLLGESGNAKELVVAVQERLETLEEGDEEESDEEEAEPDRAFEIAALAELIRRILPRIRTQQPLNFAGPPISRLAPAMRTIVTSTSRAGARAVIESALELAHDLSERNPTLYKELVESLVLLTIGIWAPSLRTNMSQRVWKALRPDRVLKPPSQAGAPEEDSDDEMLEAAHDTLSAVQLGLAQLFSISSAPLAEDDADEHSRSLAALLLLVQRLSYSLKASSFSIPLGLPFLVLAFSSPGTSDTALAYLLLAFSEVDEVDEDTLLALIHPLSTIASLFPDPNLRSISLRTLGQALSLAPARAQLAGLRTLLASEQAGGCPYPQMRAAAVGLAREAVVRGLQDETGESPTGNTLMLYALSPLIFTEPAGLSGSLDAFLSSGEQAHVAEALSFLYFLVVRDKDDRTGVRDPDYLTGIEETFLGPVRNATLRWREELGSPDSAADPGLGEGEMQLGVLGLSLERVDEALVGAGLR